MKDHDLMFPAKRPWRVVRGGQVLGTYKTKNSAWIKLKRLGGGSAINRDTGEQFEVSG